MVIMRKQTERNFKQMVNYYHLFSHKWRDRGYPSCPRCHKQIKQCPYCKSDTLLPKATTYPDYLVTRNYAFVEVKSATDSYDLYSLSDKQEEVLEKVDGVDGGSGWVYLEFTDSKQAFLIKWHAYKRGRQIASDAGFKSIRAVKTERSRAPLARDIFGNAELEWDGGWRIPKNHSFNYVKI